MKRYEVRLDKRARERLRAKAGKCTNVLLATRYRIIELSAEGWSRPRIAKATGCEARSSAPSRPAPLPHRQMLTCRYDLAGLAAGTVCPDCARGSAAASRLESISDTSAAPPAVPHRFGISR